MQSGDAGGVNTGKAQQASSLPRLAQVGRNAPRTRLGLGRPLLSYSIAVGNITSSSRGRLKQRPPNSTHLKGRPMGVAWEQTPSELGPLGLQPRMGSSLTLTLQTPGIRKR